MWTSGIGQIGHGVKAGLSGDSGCVHRIGQGVFDGVHMARRAGDGEHGGVGGHGFDAISGRQRADDARLDRNLAGLALIEDQAQARGSDLHDLDIVRNMDLVGGDVIGVFAGGCAAAGR